MEAGCPVLCSLTLPAFVFIYKGPTIQDPSESQPIPSYVKGPRRSPIFLPPLPSFFLSHGPSKAWALEKELDPREGRRPGRSRRRSPPSSEAPSSCSGPSRGRPTAAGGPRRRGQDGSKRTGAGAGGAGGSALVAAATFSRPPR